MASELEVLGAVDAFYNGSFDRLFNLTLAIMAAAGVALPIVLGFIQHRILRGERKSLLEELRAETAAEFARFEATYTSRIDTAVAAAKQELRTDLEATEKKLQRTASAVKGGIFHVQANANAQNSHYVSAITSIARAALANVKGGDEGLVVQELGMLIRWLEKVDSTDNAALDEIASDFTRLVEALEGLNETGRYRSLLRDLAKARADAAIRQPGAQE